MIVDWWYGWLASLSLYRLSGQGLYVPFVVTHYPTQRGTKWIFVKRKKTLKQHDFVIDLKVQLIQINVCVFCGRVKWGYLATVHYKYLELKRELSLRFQSNWIKVVLASEIQYPNIQKGAEEKEIAMQVRRREKVKSESEEGCSREIKDTYTFQEGIVSNRPFIQIVILSPSISRVMT